MTSGERAVFAAEFVRAMGCEHGTIESAAFSARVAVECMRRSDLALDYDTRAMLADMLSTGGDR